MQLFLTHVDTPYRMYHEGLPFTDTHLMLSEGDLSAFPSLTAVCAFWCGRQLTDEEGWLENRRMRAFIKGKLSTLKHIFSIEDARILGDSPLKRLSELWDDGIRVITPMWQGVNRLGGGYDTDVGLTSYGRHTLAAAMERGMLPDISHASDTAAKEILKLARQYRTPVLATHSNFRRVRHHLRNLTDALAYKVAESGGLIGLCLVPAHVGGEGDIPALLAHYKHGRALGLGEALCLGTDLDGTDALIKPLERASDLALLATEISDTTNTDPAPLFYRNAARLFGKYIPSLLY